jgi:hypothetical protein
LTRQQLGRGDGGGDHGHCGQRAAAGDDDAEGEDLTADDLRDDPCGARSPEDAMSLITKRGTGPIRQ